MALGRLADSMENQTDLVKLMFAEDITIVRLYDHETLIKTWIAVNNAKMPQHPFYFLVRYCKDRYQKRERVLSVFASR